MAKTISKQTLTVGIFAVLAGLIAAYGVRSYLYREEPIPSPPPPVPALIKVPVASADLPADRVVSLGDMVSLSLTRKQLEDRFKGINVEQLLLEPGKIIHRRLSKPVQRGQPFLTTKFYLEGTGPSVTGKLQPGYRAVRVEVPTSHDGGVQPGTYTDVIFRAQARPAKGDQPAIPETTVTLLRDIEVLEVDRLGKTPPRGGAPESLPKATMVTLAIPVEKAGIFSAIAGRGEVWLEPTPFKGSDEGIAGGASKSLTLADLLGIQPPRPRPAPPPPFETAIYRDGKLQVNRFIDGKLVMSRSIDKGPRASVEGKHATTAEPKAPSAPAETPSTDGLFPPVPLD